MEQVILITGKAKSVFGILELTARMRGDTTIGDIAGTDPLEQEKQADAWREYQIQREETDDKKKE